MGARPRKLGVAGEDELRGRGIAFCAVCDAPLFAGRSTVVIGGGDSAMEEALGLARHAASVTLVHRRDTFRASPIMLQRVRESSGDRGRRRRTSSRRSWPARTARSPSARLRRADGGEVRDLPVDGAFIAVGHAPHSDLVRGVFDLDTDGYIVTRAGTTETSVPRCLRLRRPGRPALPAGGHGGGLGLPGRARCAALSRASRDVTFPGISLVTGAAGFLGRHLVAHLVEQGVRVRAAVLESDDTAALERLNVERVGHDKPVERVEIVRADVTAPMSLAPLFAGGVDRVFHLAGICNFSTPYSTLRRVNVDGVDHVTLLALQAGVRCSST